MENKAFTLIDEAIHTGLITQETYDLILKLVHKDGTIDEAESKKLSALFNAMKSNAIRLEESKCDKNFRKNKAYNHLYENAEHEAQKPCAEQNIDIPETIAQPLPTLQRHSEKEESTNSFKNVSDRILEAEIKDRIWIKTGSMIAYDGVINFTREGIAEHGLGKLLKRNITGEHVSLSKAEGIGRIYLADNAKCITTVHLHRAPLYIQSQNVLAFENKISWDIQPLFNLGTALAGGLFHLMFQGEGAVAFTTSFEPLKLEVKPGKSIYTDAKSTIAWSSGVVPNIKTDISLQTLIGRSSGETVQIKFEGEGYVIVEP